MLKLPSVTLFCIDCYNPNRALLSMRFSCRFVKFAEVILLTDTKRHPKLDHLFPGLQVRHIEEGDEKIAPYPGHPPIPVDYERHALTEPIRHVGNASHILFMEWDSAILNPLAWEQDWLGYDFIGAPWAPHHDPGWPPCDETNNMGNGGFSLRSAAFCEMTRRSTVEGKDNPEMASSDRWFGRSIRRWMESFGMRYATTEVGLRFSCENQIYSGQLGFHGKTTVAINNWSGPMFDEMKKGQAPLI